MRRAAVGSAPIPPSKTPSTTSTRRRRSASRGASRVEPLESRTLLSATSGDLDPTFGVGGTVTTDVPGSAGNRVARQVALQSDGKILQAAWHGGLGASELTLAVTRFDRFGFLDTSFGDNGLQIIDFPNRGEVFPSLAVGPDDKVVVSTWTVEPTTDILGVDSDALVAVLTRDGDFDTSFGQGGYAAFDFGRAAGGPSAAKTPEIVLDVAVQPDGKIVTAGSIGIDGLGRFALARLNTDGTLDATFGGGGVVTTPFAGYTATAHSLDVDAQGRLLVLGSAATRTVNPPANGNQDWAVARYNPDGTLDTAFGGGDGWTVTTLSTATDTPVNIKAAPGGKIVAAGSTGGPNAHSDMAIVRYNADGSPDASFGGGDGVVTFGDTAVNTQGQTVQAYDDADGLAVLADGSVLVSGDSGVGFGQSNGRVLLLKFTPSGSPDATFGAAGKVVVPDLDSGPGLAVQSDGYVVVGGHLVNNTDSGFEDFALARFEPSGTPDWSFGPHGTGVTTADFESTGFTTATDGVLQPDGKVIVGGTTIVKNGNLRDIVLVRYNADGSLDDTFGTGGVVQIDFAGGDLRETLNALTLDAQGRIVFAGSINDTASNTTDFLVGRLLPDGSPDSSFAGTGFLQVQGFAGASNGNEEGNDVVVQPDGRILVVGEHRTTSTNIRFAAVRLRPDGSYDTSFGQFGTGDFHTQFTNVTDSVANTVTVAPDQDGDGFDLVLAGGARVGGSDHFALLRLNSDGSIDNEFGTAGKVTASVPGVSSGTAIANDVVADPLGRILVGGTGRVSGNGDQFALMRFTSGGVLDTAFDADGKVVTGFEAGANDLLNSLVLLPDGSILAGGTASNNFALARYTDAGALDTSFGTAGRALADFEPGFFPGAPTVSRDTGVKVFALPGDKALMVGTAFLPRTGGDFAAARFVLGGPPNQPPVADPGGPYTIPEGSGATLTAANSTDADGTIIKYEWDLSYDNFGFNVDGVGEQVAYPVQADENSTTVRRVALRVTDDNFISHTTVFTITVNNVAPAVAPIADATVAPGTPFTASGSFTDPGTLDTFTATVNYGDGPNQTLALNPDKTFTLNRTYANPGTYTVTVTVRDNDGGSGTQTFVVTVEADVNAVEGRQVFYHRSAFDTAAGGPLGAVPAQKQPLLPGGTAVGVNITNYTRGINGLIVTLDGAAGGEISADDFSFKVGTSNDPSTWADAPQPQSVTATALEDGRTRVVITWADRAIRNTWLQATVLANADTKLAAPDVFYYGNLVGNAASPPGRIDALDYLRTRQALGRPAATADLNSDHDHDGRHTVFDLAAVRSNLGRTLAMFTAPAAAAVASAPAAAASTTSSPVASHTARPPERPARRSLLDDTTDVLGRSAQA